MTAIHFLGPDSALSQFPEHWELQSLARADNPAHLDVFTYEAWIATRRLWVLDFHFWECGFRGLTEALRNSKILDIRVVSEKVRERQRHCRELQAVVDAAWSEGYPQQRPAPARVQWSDRLIKGQYPFPHDRFVILDDSLWHFGFAACGSGNHLSAASRPWSAKETRAGEFYEELWEQLVW